MKKLLSVILSFAMILGIITPVTAMATLPEIDFSLAASEETVSVGDTFTATVSLGEYATLSSFNFTLEYDADVLEYVGHTQNSMLETDNAIINAASAGQIGVGNMRTQGLGDGSAVPKLLTVTFRAKAPADASELALTECAAADTSAPAESYAVTGTHAASVEVREADISVKVSVYDFLAGDAEVTGASESGTILEDCEVTVPSSTKAYDAIVKALTERDAPIPYVESSYEGYFSSVNGLAEKAEGYDSSGWMFSVNDDFGNLGTKEQGLSDGDALKLHYSLAGYGADVGSYWSPAIPTLTAFTLAGVENAFTCETGEGDALVYKMNGAALAGDGGEESPFEIAIPVPQGSDVGALSASLRSTLSGRYQHVTPDVTAETDFTAPVTFALSTDGDVLQTYYRVTVVQTDVTAPALSAVEAVRTGTDTASLAFTSDEAGVLYYAVTAANATEPALELTGAGTPVTAGENAVPITGLGDNGAKTVWFAVKDAAGNVSETMRAAAAEFVPAEVTITFSVWDGAHQKYLVLPQELTVTEGTAAEFGCANAAPGTLVGGMEHDVAVGQVTVLDAILAAHQAKYGEDFTPAAMGSYTGGLKTGYATKLFGVSGNISFAVNDRLPVGTKSDGYSISECVLGEGDDVLLFYYGDAYWGDYISWFDKDAVSATVGANVELSLSGYSAMAQLWGTPGSDTVPITPEAIANAQLVLIGGDGEILSAEDSAALNGDGVAMTDENGKAVFRFTAPGVYRVSAIGLVESDFGDVPITAPYCEITVISADVQAAIEAIGAIGAVTDESESAIVSAQLLYRALSAADKAKVTNAAVLTEAVESYAALEGVYTVTVKAAPATAEASFYHTNGFAPDNTDIPGSAIITVDEGTVSGYHQYQLYTKQGTVSFRGVDGEQPLGGMTFEAPAALEVGMDGKPVTASDKYVVNLRRYNLYVTTKLDGSNYPTAEQYGVGASDADGKEAVFGPAYQGGSYTYYPSLLYCNGNAELYAFRAYAKGEYAASYGETQQINQALAASGVAATGKSLTLYPVQDFALTVPTGAKAQVFGQVRNFYSPEVKQTSQTDNGNGTTTHHFNVSTGMGSLSYRVSMDGKITRTAFFSATAGAAEVSFESGENPAARVEYDTSAYPGSVAEDSVLLNVNRDNFLTLEAGESFRLRAYRAWQAVSSVTANVMAEPDFHFRVVSGEDVLTVTPVASGNGNAAGNWLDLRAEKAGVAILEITYDALYVGDSLFGATDPQRAGYVAVQVGGKTAETDWGVAAAGSDGLWDSELDTVYFFGESGKFEFSPVVTGDAIASAACNGEALESETSVYTAEIVPGNNLLKVTTASGATAYKLIRGAKLALNVKKTAGDPALEGYGVGDTLAISFTGLYAPVPKFAGVYNPGFGNTQKITYTSKTGTVQGKGAQYDFINNHTVTLTITDELAEDGKLTLTNGSIPLTVMGASDMFTGGGHRGLTDTGIGANFNASSVPGEFDILPDIELAVAKQLQYEITLSGLPADAVIVMNDASGAAVAASESNKLLFASLPYGVYSYEITAVGKKPLRGSFEVSAAAGMGTRTIPLTMEDIAANGWDGTALTEPPYENGAYQIGTGAQLAWLAAHVNDKSAQSPADAVLLADIDLSGFAWTPIGISGAAYAADFDGDGHSVSGLFIESGGGYNGLFGVLNAAAVKDLSVAGVVRSGGSYAGGVAASAQGGCAFDGVSSEVAITMTGSSNTKRSYVGGITGSDAGGSYTGCSFSGSIENGYQYIGGIAGTLLSRSGGGEVLPAVLTDCANSGAIGGYQYVGGLAGSASSSVLLRGENTGAVAAGSASNAYAGGIAGRMTAGSQARLCKNSGDVTGASYVGGVAGSIADACLLRGCENSGGVLGSNNSIGGIVGYMSGSGASYPTVRLCKNSGDVSASAKSSGNLGGIAGNVSGVLRDVLNTGSVTAEGSAVKAGGIAGYLSYSSASGIRNAYNSGDVTGPNGASVGAVIGMLSSATVPETDPIANAYYLAGSAALAAGQTGVAVAAEVKTSDELKALAPALGVWFKADQNGGYPALELYPAPALAGSYDPDTWLTTLPTVTVALPEGCDGALERSVNDDAFAKAEASYTPAEDGAYRVSYRIAYADDSSGAVTASFKSDALPPVIASVTGNPTQWAKDDVTLTVSASDATSGLPAEAYSFDNGESWQASASKAFSANRTVLIKVRDAAGNISAAHTESITKLDKTLPAVEAAFAQTRNEAAKGVVAVAASDALSGLASVKLTGPDGYAKTLTAAPFTFDVTAEGSYTATATDAAGNAAADDVEVAFATLTALSITKADGQTGAAPENGVLYLTVPAGEDAVTYSLKAAPQGTADGSLYDLVWSSTASETAASVDQNGMLTAKETGIATVAVSAMGQESTLLVKVTRETENGTAATSNPAQELAGMLTGPAALLPEDAAALTAVQKEWLAAISEAVRQLSDGAKADLTEDILNRLDALLSAASGSEPGTSLAVRDGDAIPPAGLITEAPEAVGTMTAAGFTGTDNAGDTVELRLTQRKTAGREQLAFSLELLVNGAPAQLKTPLVIAVHVPEGYAYSAAQRLTHKKDDGKSEQLSFLWNEAERTVAFRVTSFSEFVISLRESGGSSDDNDQAEQTAFWKNVADELAKAPAGTQVEVTARSYDRMPTAVMEALRANGGVSLKLRWDGGDAISIPAGKAQPAEAGRVYYPLSLLSALYAGEILPQALTAVNPQTGGVLSLAAPQSAARPFEAVTPAHEGLAAAAKQAPAAAQDAAPAHEMSAAALLALCAAALAAYLSFRKARGAKD